MKNFRTKCVPHDTIINVLCNTFAESKFFDEIENTHNPAFLNASGSESSPVPSIALTICANACSGLRLVGVFVRSANRYVSS